MFIKAYILTFDIYVLLLSKYRQLFNKIITIRYKKIKCDYFHYIVMKKCYNVFDEVKLVSTVFKLTRFATFGFLVYLNMYVSSATWVVAVSSAANSVEFMSSLCLFRQGEHISNKKKRFTIRSALEKQGRL